MTGVSAGGRRRRGGRRDEFGVVGERAVEDRDGDADALALARLERDVDVGAGLAGVVEQERSLRHAEADGAVRRDVDALRLDFRRAFRDVVAGTVDAGVRAGEVPPQDAQAVASALVGAIAEALVGPLSGGDAVSTVPTLVTFVLRAVGLPDVPPPRFPTEPSEPSEPSEPPTHPSDARGTDDASHA